MGGCSTLGSLYFKRIPIIDWNLLKSNIIKKYCLRMYFGSHPAVGGGKLIGSYTDINRNNVKIIEDFIEEELCLTSTQMIDKQFQNLFNEGFPSKLNKVRKIFSENLFDSEIDYNIIYSEDDIHHVYLLYAGFGENFNKYEGLDFAKKFCFIFDFEELSCYETFHQELRVNLNEDEWYTVEDFIYDTRGYFLTIFKPFLERRKILREMKSVRTTQKRGAKIKKNMNNKICNKKKKEM